MELKKRTHLSFHQMSLYSPSKRRKKIEKSLSVKKINNLESGKRIDPLEKVACAKFVKLILNQPNLPSTQRYKVKLMLLRQQASRFQSKDQRTEKIVGNLLKRNVRCFWCSRCSKLNKRKSRDLPHMQPCMRMVSHVLRICLRQILRLS